MSSLVVYNIFFALGGIAVLMFGMRIMGSGLEEVAGNNMKKMLGKLTNNRILGVGVGAAMTAIINSSTATTVMLVGFVNVGLLTLTQAAAVIMGANIGTTITAQILSLSGSGGVDVGAIAALIAAAGMVITVFCKKDRVRKIGDILLGLGLIFIGLKIMSVCVDAIIYDGDVIKPEFESLFKGDHFPLLLILLGIIFTAIIHSSAAVTGVLIALGGALKFETAVFIILGSNIGTCITALVSSVGTSTNAKRTAIIHLLFNLSGCLICIAPLWIWSASFTEFMRSISGNSVERQIANFHTLFNVVTTIVLVPFIDLLVFLAKKIIPDVKTVQSERHKLTFIDDRLLETPRIAMDNAKKEIIKMANIAKENVRLSVDSLLSGNFETVELQRDNEDAINFLNHSISDFLTKIMGKGISSTDEEKLSTYYHVVIDMERVGDYAENIIEYAAKLKEEGSEFSEEAKAELREVRDVLSLLFEKSFIAFNNRDLSVLPEVDRLEQRIDDLSVELESRHVERVKKGLCTAQLGSVYLQTVSNLERVGDHITNVAFSIKKYVNR